MEQAQRANAAQLAARKIREKPRPRRTISQTPASTTQQQFSAMQAPSQNGGGTGLFGGTINVPGEFSFSAPTQVNFTTPSFRSNSMNGPSQDVSDSDGRFAGDDRATKRPFGGASTISQNSSPFQSSNSFGQGQPSNPFGSTQQPSGASMFPFGTSQQSGAAGISFNSGSTDASSKNPFNFQPTSQPTTTTPSSSFGTNLFNFNQQPSQTADPFGSTPTARQDKPANPPFSFGQTSGQSSTSSTMFGGTSAPDIHTNNLLDSAQSPAAIPQPSNLFGSITSTTPATPKNSLFHSSSSAISPVGSLSGKSKPLFTHDKPASSPFSFGQASTTPSNSAFTFGSTPASSGPMGNLLGANQTLETADSSPKSSEMPMQQAAPSSNPFPQLNSPAIAAISTAFGKQDHKAAAPVRSNPFGALPASPAPRTTNFFGNSVPAPATPNTSTPFGQQQPQPTPASNLFGGVKRPSETITGSNVQDQQASTGSIFENKGKTNDDLFGNLNKPVDQSITNPEVNGSPSGNGNNPSTPLFNKPEPFPSVVGAPKSAVSLLIVSRYNWKSPI